MAMSNQLSKQGNKKATFSSFMTSPAVVQKVNNMVGGKDGQRFITAIISAVSTNTALQKCDGNSILSAAMLGESLKLSPSPQLGQYYMVPYGDKAQFQLGYKGYIQLAIRSGQYKKLNVMAIKEGELIQYDPLNEEIEVKLIDDELLREKATTVGYYAMFEYTNGFRKTMYWSKEKMESHAKTYSKAYNSSSSFWKKDFDVMAYKTMLRQLISKWGIMSIEMQKAYENDMAAIKEDGSKEYVDSNDLVSSFDTSNVVAEVKEEPKTTEEVLAKMDAEMGIVDDDPMA